MAFEPTISNKMDTSMNVSALKIADPSFSQLIDNATHVVVYSFKPDTNEWEKINIEGAMFIYSRVGEPKYNLIVVNRLSTLNLVEPINTGVILQVQEPFMLYRSSRGNINGVWFYSEKECIKVAKSISQVIAEVNNSPKNKNSVDMLALLGKSDSNRVPNNVSDIKVPDGTSKRVLDFFAMASNSAPSQPPSRINMGQQRKDMGQGDVKPLLQRLLSNPGQPVKTVEQIEKQHRSVTPKKEPDGHLRPRSLAIPSGSHDAKLENGFGFMRISESSSSSPPNGHLRHHSPLEEPGVDPLDLQETPSKPALITPNMFTSSKKEAEVEEPRPEIDLDIRPEPLTKAQLLQAVSYLLKNDSDFINKLHEAYVKSFTDKVS